MLFRSPVVELIIADTKISGYAFYESGKLAKVILINLLPFLEATKTPRESTHVNFTLFLLGNSTVPFHMSIKRLSLKCVQFLLVLS